jgi:hypothetical protein
MSLEDWSEDLGFADCVEYTSRDDPVRRPKVDVEVAAAWDVNTIVGEEDSAQCAG